MVENRPWLTFAAHAVLMLGVLIVGFPGLHDVRRLDP